MTNTENRQNQIIFQEGKEKALKAAKKKLEITIKNKNKIKKYLVDLDDILVIKD